MFVKRRSENNTAERATAESLVEDNLALNLEIVEEVQTDAQGPRDVLKAIRKRMIKSGQKDKVQLLCLSVRSFISSFRPLR